MTKQAESKTGRLAKQTGTNETARKQNMKWTQRQQEAIDLRDKNILVSAAAGSGKTAVLVERIKRLLLEDRIPLSAMLIVTFSEAAASEMKEKIVRALESELGETAEDEEKQKYLRKQLTGIYHCNISTFHAFAMEVIRRYFHLIGVEPGFKICDDGQKTILQSQALDELFAERFAERDEDFLSFLNLYGTAKNESDVREMIQKVREFIQSLPEPFLWLEEKTAQLSAAEEDFGQSAVFHAVCAEIDSELLRAAVYLKKSRELLEEAGVESLIPKVQKDIDLVLNARAALTGRGGCGDDPSEETCYTPEQFERAASFLRKEQGGFQRMAASKADKENYEPVKEVFSAVRERGKDIFEDLGKKYAAQPLAEYAAELAATAGPAAVLFDLVREFDRIYHEKKAQKNLLDFNDIEHYALQVLAHPEAAEEYRRRFSYIFIDEYQDSNLVQETLINRICRDNNVFMVGDVKQSIYKFRLAEPELFIEKYERFRRNDGEPNAKVDLNQNFRSKGGIIRGVNQVFSRIMSRKSTGMDYDKDAALYQGVEYEGELDYPVSLHLVDDQILEDMELDEEIRDMKKAELEAAAAARLIADAIGKPIYDAKQGCVRALENRDIAVLLRSAKNYADIYYKAIADRGIPVFMDNSDGYFDTVEIQIFLNLLQVIDNGKQDLPLLSVLRSPIFNFSVEELAEVRIASRRGAYYEAFACYGKEGSDSALREKCRSAGERLTAYREKASYTPLSDFLAFLITDTGYGTFVSAIPGGVQRYANLRALVDRAIEYESASGGGLFGFVQYIDALKKGKIKMGQVKLAGENENVVRIMTVHKSKGLEFPFVLLGGLGKQFNLRSDTSKAALHKDLGLALRLVCPEQKYYKKTLLASLIEGRARREGIAEEIRILYVGFTRAMDELVLLGTVTDAERYLGYCRQLDSRDAAAARSYLDMVTPALLAEGVRPFCHGREEYGTDKKEDDGRRERVRRGLTEGFAIPRDEGAEEKEREIRRRLAYRYPAAGEERKSKYSVSELAAQMEEAETANEASSASEAETGGEVEVGGAASSVKTASILKAAPAVPRFMEQSHRMTAAERGTAMHKVLEHIPFTTEKKTPEEIGAFAAELVEQEILTPEEAASINCRAISAFFSSEIGRRACLAQELYREVSFNMKKELFGEEVIVQGTIDCYFREGSRYVLLDYKSGYSVFSDESGENGIGGGIDGGINDRIAALVRRYRPQTELYREALEKIKKVPVAEIYLYLFSLGREVRVE